MGPSSVRTNPLERQKLYFVPASAMSSAVSSTDLLFAVSHARGSGDQLTAHEAIQELVHAAGDP
jgi:hypothetical protein